MTTVTEVRAHVDRLWGLGRVQRIGLRADGGADVELAPYRPSLDSDNGVGEREHTYSNHRLDADGRPICHAACQKLEADHDRRRPR